MWTSVVPADLDIPAPSTRSKHSATLIGDEVYLLGGRNGNLPMRDFWKYNLVTGKWHLLKPSGEKLPLLQEHSAVAYKNCIYIFGGEVSFSAATETPLWRYDIGKNIWKKIRSKKGVTTPKGRRGHSALIHRGSMIIYGGYQDLRGSSNELWVFHFETESWHCLSMSTKNQNSEFPPPRHKHSAIIHDDVMWIYGGMTDLQERADLWKWDTLSKMWTNIKTKISPGPLHSHAVCRLPSAMLLFGGERNGHPTNELWKFNFSVDAWEKITVLGTKPQPRSESVAFSVSELVLKDVSDSERTCRVRYRTSNSADRNSRHSSYLPNNRIVPCEKTYVFQPSSTNYTDGSDIAQQYAETRCTRNILQDISKISQIKILNNKCSYTVLNGVATESTESLLNNYIPPNPNNEDFLNEEESTPSRLVKSKSAFVIKKKILTEPDENLVQNSGKIPHEPFSVPNISSLTLPKLSLTPVEVAKLVYLDTDDENEFSNYDSLQKSNTTNLMYDCFTVQKEESYSSHLAYADNPLYQHMMKSNSGKENVSLTSDYASFETVNNHSSSSNYSVKTRDIEGPFGFCNPNYLGPDIKLLHNNKNKENEPELSNSNECLELQEYNGINKNTKVYYRPSPRLKTRAHSASRAEHNHVEINDKNLEDVGDTFIPLNIYVVGGKEQGQVTVFKRPISIWKLKLF